MSNQMRPFKKLLEQYVYDTAVECIDQADPVTQAKIIDLINEIHAFAPASELLPEKTTQETTILLPAESYEKQLEAQWQEALRKPVGTDWPQEKAINTTTQRLIDLYQTQIESTTLCIGQLQRLLERTRNNIAGPHRKAQLITHYQGIINRSAAYLSKMQALQELELSKVQV